MILKLSGVFAGLLIATSAQAQTNASAWTDLNLRAGPGVAYDVVAVIPTAEQVKVDGCLEASNWCRVTYGEFSGWASGDYLTAPVQAPLTPFRQQLAVPTVTYEPNPAATIGGTAAGALVGGPVGALVGGVIGMGVGAAATPDERVITYVRSNPVEPVFLDGEVVVGAGIPETVPLVQVPDSNYFYAYINGVRVLVERDTRQIFHIVRRPGRTPHRECDVFNQRAARRTGPLLLFGAK